MLFAAIRAPRLTRRILAVLVCLGALLCFGLELGALAWTGSRLGSEHEGTSACLDFRDYQQQHHHHHRHHHVAIVIRSS